MGHTPIAGAVPGPVPDCDGLGYDLGLIIVFAGDDHVLVERESCCICVSNRPIPSRGSRVAPIDISWSGISFANICIRHVIRFTRFKVIRVDIEPCVESVHGYLIVSRLEVNCAQTQADWRS